MVQPKAEPKLWKDPPCLIGKPSISMGHGEIPWRTVNVITRGYVPYFLGWSRMCLGSMQIVTTWSWGPYSLPGSVMGPTKPVRLISLVGDFLVW